ncbi:hypothetical protein WR25_14850 [Diploscapter pachys]|uniref:Globin domain-containing protein n=1 Tax=Diploscapter pachys TaxID=2018661 RepID=A0A2A2KND4_9BILA|nr:hypothetical protein WR25_14850 [Diploscapter pachys]
MSMSRAEIAKHCKESLKNVHLGTDDEGLQTAKDFYKYFFTNFPDLRKYFKGAESFTADDVQKSERFEKQGSRLQLAVHTLAEIFENEMVFKAYAREMVHRHRVFKMDPALWIAFFTVYTGFLNSRGALNDQQKAAWMALGKEFDSEVQFFLKHLGLPHV